MGWKTLNSNAHDIKKHKDKPIVGTYTDFDIVENQIGKQVIWNFTSAKGEGFGIYGFANLNMAMKRIQPGTKVRITYLGTVFMKTKFKKDGQDVHQARVEVDEDSARKAIAAGAVRPALPNLHEAETPDAPEPQDNSDPVAGSDAETEEDIPF